MTLALLFGLIPPLILLIYVYRIDKVERETFSLIVKIFILGMLSTIPACIIEYFGEQILIFLNSMKVHIHMNSYVLFCCCVCRRVL